MPPAGLRVQLADGTERTPDAVLYAGRTSWLRRPFRPRLDRWEVYVIAHDDPIGFSADVLPGRCSLVFHLRRIDA